ncbi:hypothetical protein J5N97_007736 [Dioscorea zingiberensis]|uniref:Protein E6-like n=1 Tax=Dioscorea zingiberensis TaxID=325984 RepID=A0A9D5DEX6_9LILI|nr:hypothetical protein J5N97_007736 [Dioscorea zingiberensis]
MASSSLKQLSMAILIFLISISLLQIQARDSMFFSKMQRNETEQVPKETPATANEEPMTFPPDSGHGHGLYGHGPDEFSSTTTSDETNINDAEKNDKYVHYRGKTPSRFVNNEFNGDGYERQRSYGMSDTRVLENGRYYYDVQAERSQNGYDPLSDQDSAGYTSYNGNEGYYYGYGGYRPGSNGNAHKEYNNERFGNQYNNEGQEAEYVP